EEAERRGLANLKNTAEALPAFVLPKNVHLLTKWGVYRNEEIMSRHEIHMEKYCKVVRIEAATLVDMVQHCIINAVSEYCSRLCDTILKKREALPNLSNQVETSLASAVGILNEQLLYKMIELKTALDTVPNDASPEQLMHYYHDVVEKGTEEVRRIIDKLEALTASKYWPYPTFYELLFSV
ncbi:MAG: glutamine synthetase type III, partial [Oscillospiraceae bacterium]|nr:glutamine synthetase type III [Oscillospiraceae bacterium]